MDEKGPFLWQNILVSEAERLKPFFKVIGVLAVIVAFWLIFIGVHGLLDGEVIKYVSGKRGGGIQSAVLLNGEAAFWNSLKYIGSGILTIGFVVFWYLSFFSKRESDEDSE